MLKRLLIAILLTTTVMNSSLSYGAMNSTTTAALTHNSLPSILSSKRPNGLSGTVAKLAYQAYFKAKAEGVAKSNIMTIIDYSKPSNERRLWVVDVKNNKLIMNTLVSHGNKSGDRFAKSFSDKMHSHKTSIGLYITDKAYRGMHGLSLRLRGLDKGYNANALKRAIVVHGAHYVSTSAAKQRGTIGRSWGCPAVPQNEATPLINTIKGGSLLFAYYPDQSWLKNSKYLA